MEPSEAPAKSALPMQLDQYDRGTYVSTVNTSHSTATTANHDFDLASKTSNEKLLLRKLSKMISDEQWVEIDTFLRSPAQMAAYRSGLELPRSPPRKVENAQGNFSTVVHGLTSSFNGLALDMDTLSGNDCNSMEIVHYACRFNPPRTIIRHLTYLYPKGVLLADKMGRLPLHYAAKWGCSYRLIDYLIEKDKSAASVQDVNGKTPLHLLCENYSSSSDLNLRNDLSPEDNMSEATKALVDAAPSTVNIEDNDGITAIEYAIASDSPLDAVKAIQKASERDWKERKTSMPGTTHLKIEARLIQEHQRKQKEQEMDREKKTHMNDVSTHRVQLSSRRLPPKNPRARSKYAMTA